MKDFYAWHAVDAPCFDDELDSLADRLAVLYQLVYSTGRDSGAKAKREHDRPVNPVELEIGGKVLLWSSSSVKLKKRKK